MTEAIINQFEFSSTIQLFRLIEYVEYIGLINNEQQISQIFSFSVSIQELIIKNQTSKIALERQ